MDMRTNIQNLAKTKQQGFSLVELLVAVFFTGILMAGMATVFKSSVSNFVTANESTGALRTNRWALEQISDDISQMGFRFPDRTLPSHILTGTDNIFSITPGVAVGGVTRVSDSDPSATQAETISTDILQFLSDVPLPLAGTWGADTTGNDPDLGSGAPAGPPANALIDFTEGSESSLRAGDLMVIQDSGENGKWETVMISGSANPVVFETNTTSRARFALNPAPDGISLSHKKGVPVIFVRPWQLVRFTVQPVALDPSNAAVRLPCLVRQQTDYPDAGTVDWTTVPGQVISENTEGFRVDVSFDGGTTWARTGAATWATIQTNANTQLTTYGLPGLKSITDPLNRDWFRSISCLIRIDLTTRAPIRREEYSATQGARAYRTRIQTLMISPRNYSLGK